MYCVIGSFWSLYLGSIVILIGSCMLFVKLVYYCVMFAALMHNPDGDGRVVHLFVHVFGKSLICVSVVSCDQLVTNLRVSGYSIIGFINFISFGLYSVSSCIVYYRSIIFVKIPHVLFSCHLTWQIFILTLLGCGIIVLLFSNFEKIQYTRCSPLVYSVFPEMCAKLVLSESPSFVQQFQLCDSTDEGCVYMYIVTQLMSYVL